ncbi:MAG TPA: FCD domain-containing protein [Caulobacteraceae bacterium]|jgi:DNA-binding FadR family transcriptional regulator|nr:FCD domain-containing protein [Caulobacteraceae bacterium]
MARRRKPQADLAFSAMLRQTVEALREESSRCAEGELIGSEGELRARHQVSRPTLRKAAALVTQEQLLQVRPGARGGYFARRPTGRAVAHMAAIFLSTRGTNRDEIRRSMAPIRAELARLAAVNLDETCRHALKDFLRREAEDGGFRDFVKREREFGQVLGAASRNDVLSLFYDILLDLAAQVPPEQDVFLGRPERVKAYLAQRARLVEAILDGDSSVAELLSHRLSELLQAWRDEQDGRAHPATAHPPELTYATHYA